MFVLLYNSWFLFFGTPVHVAGMAWPEKVLFLAGALGSQSVLALFVIGGFLVGGPALINLRTRKFCLLDYLVNRFSRIFIVLFPH